MTEYPITKVQPLTATTEVPHQPPAFNWKEMDNFDPHWLTVIGGFVLVCLIGRLFLKVLGLYGTCIVGWLMVEMASYGSVGFMINPIYCIVMAFVAGSITFIGLIVLSEIALAPGRIWWKITR